MRYYLLLISLFAPLSLQSSGLIISLKESSEQEQSQQEPRAPQDANDLLPLHPFSTPPLEEKESKKHLPPSLEERERSFSSAFSTPSYEKTFMQTILLLLGFLALIFLITWVIRKFSRGRVYATGNTIRILEKRPLSHKSILYLVEISGKKVLIAESQVEIAYLTTLDQPEKKEYSSEKSVASPLPF